MKSAYILVCAIFAAIILSEAEAKGGRSSGGFGGRSGGRSGSRSSSSGWGFFGGSSKSSSSNSNSGSKSSYSTSGNRYIPYNSNGVLRSNTGGFYAGLTHSTPYHYSPIYIGSNHHSHYSGSLQQNSYSDENRQRSVERDIIGNRAVDKIENADEAKFAIAYTVSKALSNDFFSIFNMVHDISKYPSKLENKDSNAHIPTTTTTSSTTTTTTSTTTEAPDFQQNFHSFASTENSIIDYRNSLTPLEDIFGYGGYLSNRYNSDTDFPPLKSDVNKFDYFGTPIDDDTAHSKFIAGNVYGPGVEKDIERLFKQYALG